ncbi:MAG: 23S rRNA (guanosine(2251)-2'-O)-methyltransferase RlmB, partial [Chloroflexi bacterium]
MEILYGRHAVHESLRAGRRQPSRLLLATGVRQTDVIEQIVLAARQAGVTVSRVARSDLDQLGDVNHQGVALETSEYPYVTPDAILARARSQSEAPWLLLLDLLKDPQNVGTLLRTADAVGVHGVIIQRRRA